MATHLQKWILLGIVRILSIVVFCGYSLYAKASTSEYVTMSVGERRTLTLPTDIASLTLKDVTFSSGDWSKLNIVSNTATSVTVEALESSSSYIPVTCEFYYYTLENGKWIYARHAPFYFMVAIIGGKDPGGSDSENGSTEWGYDGTCTINTLEGVAMKFKIVDNVKLSNGDTYLCAPYPHYVKPEGATCIDKGTKGTVTIPEYVNGRRVFTTGQCSFKNCNQMNAVIIPSTVTDVANASFRGCTSMTTVVISSSLNYISSYGFSDCTSLSSISPLLSVTSIEEGAFGNCSSLTSIVLGSKLKNIGSVAFNYCDSLISLYCLTPTPPQMGNIRPISMNTTSKATLFVPKGSAVAYKSATIWEEFQHIEEIVLPTNLAIPSSLALGLGEHATLSTSVTPAEAMDSIIWQTSNPKIAIVSAEGVVTSVGIGTASITAMTINGLTAACEVTCQQVNQSVTLSDAGYATFYSSESAYMLPEGLSANVVTGISNNRLTYKTIADGSVKGIIPKGVAVLLKADKKASKTYLLESVISEVNYSGINLLQGSDEETTATGDGYCYKLSYGKSGSKQSNLFGWYWGADNGNPFQIGAHRAWLVIPKSERTRGNIAENTMFVIEARDKTD